MHRTFRFPAIGLSVAALGTLCWAGTTAWSSASETQVAGQGSAGLPAWVAELFTDRINDCAEMREHLAEEGQRLRATVAREGVVFELEYRPAACTACMEMPEAELTDAAYNERQALLAGTSSYLLRIRRTRQAQDAPGRSSLKPTDILEVHGQDTLPCAFVHEEILPGMVPYTQALIGFDRPQDATPPTVLLKDTEGNWGGDVVLAVPAQALSKFHGSLPNTH